MQLASLRIFAAAVVGASALFLGSVFYPATALAEAAGCSLQIRDEVLFDGPCDADLETEGGFSFEVTDRKGALVHLSIFSEDATGLINVVIGKENSYQSLSGLVQKGRCWATSQIRACSWPTSERPPQH